MDYKNISFSHGDTVAANFLNFKFSPLKAQKRISKANDILGKNVVRWLIGFVLFLLGAKRKDVSNLLGIPYETLNSFISRIWKDGIKAFEDRRTSWATPQTPPERAVSAPTAIIEEDEIVVHFPYESSVHIRIPYTNNIVAKAFLLTLLENQILDSQTVADILGYSRNYTLYLKREMIAGSTEVLLDGRQGQMQDYVFKTEIKAELILQWSANAIAGKSTASEVLAADIKQRCGLDLSDRSIRFHIQRLGLKKIYKTLPEILEALKKNSGK